MCAVVSIVLLVAGFILKNETIILTSGLFAIASSIGTVAIAVKSNTNNKSE